MSDGDPADAASGAALHDCPAWLRSVVEHISEALLVADHDDRVLYTNSQFRDLFGELVAGAPVPPALRAASPTWTEVRDGSTRWIESTTVPIADPDGAVVATQTLLRDATRPKLAEVTLQHREYLLTEAQRIAHIGSWSLDVATGEVSVSDETRRILGVAVDNGPWPRGQLLQQALPEERPRLYAWLQRQLAGETGAPIVVRVARLDGGRSMLRVQGELVIGGGDRALLIGTVQDVTAQYQHDATLEFLSTDLSHLTGDQQFEEIAGRLAAIAGGDAGFVIEVEPGGGVITRALVVDGRPLPAPGFAGDGGLCRWLLDGAPMVEVEGLAGRFSDDPVVKEVGAAGCAAAPLVDRAGAVIGSIGMMTRDRLSHPELARSTVSMFALRTAAKLARERADQALRALDAQLLAREEALRRASESRLAYMLRTTRAVLYTRSARPPFELTYVSPSVTELLGHRPDCLLARPGAWLRLVHPEDLAAADTWHSLPADRDHVRVYRFQTASGRYLWVRDQCRLVGDRDGELEIVGHWVDISERMLIEAQLAATAAAATEASHMKTVFLASMSHELRTPLNAVLGLSEALLDPAHGELSEHQRRNLHTILASGRHLTALVDDVLDIARIEAGRLEVTPEPVRLLPLVEECVSYVEDRAGGDEGRVAIEIDERVEMVTADPRRLRQILINLVDNAFKHGGDQAAVTVAARPVAGGVELSVADTGPGVPPQHRDRIFEPFVVLERPIPRRGVGLGLALVRRLVGLHGGTVRIDDDAGRGARFVIHLPSGAAPSTELPTPHVTDQQVEGDRGRS